MHKVRRQKTSTFEHCGGIRVWKNERDMAFFLRGGQPFSGRGDKVSLNALFFLTAAYASFTQSSLVNQMIKVKRHCVPFA